MWHEALRYTSSTNQCAWPFVGAVVLQEASLPRGFQASTGRGQKKTVNRPDVHHDGYFNVTCFFTDKRHHWGHGKVHHLSGLHPELQCEIVHHNRFTECLILLHQRLVRTIQTAIESQKAEIHFVISCNAGCQRSVAMLSIMEAVFKKSALNNITTQHQHLWGCTDPYVRNTCCQCVDCSVPHAVAPHVLQSAYQQWRAVCR